MMKLKALMVVLIGIVIYLTLWPVDVDPISWQAPVDRGYVGDHETNEMLRNIQQLSLNGFTGPEDIAFDDQGRMYASVEEGIVRLDIDGLNPMLWVEMKGRPLGIDFDDQGNLIVADGIQGLLAITEDRNVVLLTNVSEGVEIGFADDVDVAEIGKIYFSDASSKFRPRDYDNVLQASEFDVLEHGGHGRLLMYDPETKRTSTLLEDLNFPNGVTVAHDERSVLVNEMGTYRVLKYWIEGELKGSVEVIRDNLPGFPDNITKGQDSRYWISLAKPRSPELDKLSESPFLRKVAARVMPLYKPDLAPYAHVIAIDGQGDLLHDYQNPALEFHEITSARETDQYLYLGSLVENDIARIEKNDLGL